MHFYINQVLLYSVWHFYRETLPFHSELKKVLQCRGAFSLIIHLLCCRMVCTERHVSPTRSWTDFEVRFLCLVGVAWSNEWIFKGQQGVPQPSSLPVFSTGCSEHYRFCCFNYFLVLNAAIGQILLKKKNLESKQNETGRDLPESVQ